MLLRPEDGTDLKDPLEGAHHSLLIELGGLGEKCLAPEVVQPEDVAAPLGPGVDDLGGVDLGEALGGEVLPEGPADPLLHLEDGAGAQAAQHQGPQGQLRVQVQPQPPLGDGHRHGRGGPGQHPHLLRRQLPAPGGPFLPPHRLGDHRGTLLTQPLRQLLRPAHALDRPVPHPQGKEGDPAHGPQAVDRPLQGDGLPVQRSSRDFPEPQGDVLCFRDILHADLILS